MIGITLIALLPGLLSLASGQGTLMAKNGGLVSVLVVDDDPAILALIATILDRNGLRALLARDGEEAMAIAQRSHVAIDLILSDIEISGVSGADPLPEILENTLRSSTSSFPSNKS